MGGLVAAAATAAAARGRQRPKRTIDAPGLMMITGMIFNWSLRSLLGDLRVIVIVGGDYSRAARSRNGAPASGKKWAVCVFLARCADRRAKRSMNDAHSVASRGECRTRTHVRKRFPATVPIDERPGKKSSGRPTHLTRARINDDDDDEICGRAPPTRRKTGAISSVAPLTAR